MGEGGTDWVEGGKKNSNEYASIIAQERKSIFILYKIEYRPSRYTVDSVYGE